MGALMKNPLEEYPHLFANGKFEIRWKHEGVDFTEDLNLKKESWMMSDPKIISNCTLIARPIEDMAEEEWEEYKALCQKSENHSSWWDSKYSYIETIDSFLYALSIGVLPKRFEDHFGDTVIDTRTLTNA